MRKAINNDKALYKVVKEKEEYYEANYKPLHERTLEIEKELEEIRAKKTPHMKAMGKFAEKAIKLMDKNNPIEGEFEEIGQVYTEDGAVIIELRDAVDEFKTYFREEKEKARTAKK